MKLLHPLLGKCIMLELSGKRLLIQGNLVDMGNDIIVLYTGSQFMYIPAAHVQQMTTVEEADDIGQNPELPFDHAEISYRKILMNAKGIFTEMYISGNQSMHGYVTSIMNDFFVFFSPVYRTVYVSMAHVKSIVPYESNTTPYLLSQERFPLQPTGMTLTRTFEQQLKKLEGELVVLDLADSPNKIGKLNAVEHDMLELVTANGQRMFTHMNHVKTVHLP